VFYTKTVGEIQICPIICGARGSVVGCGTMLQAGRSPVRFPDEVYFFSIYVILRPWGRLSL
jgi:hypothetical protein